MEIKKLLMLTTSGSQMPITNLEQDSTEILTFQNMENI